MSAQPFFRARCRFGLAVMALVLAVACAPLPETGARPVPRPAPEAAGAELPPPDVAARNFIAVVDRVEPVAERICRERAPFPDCDLRVMVDGRRDQPPNAFHTLGPDGEPLVIFTISLIAQARNQDELAFIMGHEAGHYIAGHVARVQARAMEGALLAGILAQVSGADITAVRTASRLGAEVAARAYAPGYELEADALGAEIALAAGYDPLRGAEYFSRIPDPGNSFLATHPPNAARMSTVRRTVERLRGGAGGI